MNQTFNGYNYGNQTIVNNLFCPNKVNMLGDLNASYPEDAKTTVFLTLKAERNDIYYEEGALEIPNDPKVGGKIQLKG